MRLARFCHWANANRARFSRQMMRMGALWRASGVTERRHGRKNRQSAVDLRPHGTESEGQDGVFVDRDGPHALLRLPAIGFGNRARIQDALSFIYRAGAGVL